MEDFHREPVDPENAAELDVDPEKIDALMEQLSAKTRLIGLHLHSATVAGDPDEEPPQNLFLTAAFTLGDLAWKTDRHDPVAKADNEAIIGMEMEMLDHSMDEIKNRYLKE